MRRVSGVSLWSVVLACLALWGCSGDNGSPALAINDSEKATVLAWAAEGASALARGVETAVTITEPDVAPDPIPETADKALRSVLEGLHENRPDALWDALPASYQQDVNDLVHLFAARMHPEAWKWFVQIARKGAVVMRLPRDDREEASLVEAAVADEGDDEGDEDAADAIQQMSISDRLAIPKNQNARLHGLLARQQNQSAQMQETIADKVRREAVAQLLDQIADSGPVGLEKLKSADIGALLRCAGGRTLLEAWRAAAGTEFGTENVQDFLALVADPSKVRLVLKESTDAAAVVEIMFPNDVPGDIECVRVDRKWIPRMLADAWAETISDLKRSVHESLPSETATENFGLVFQFLGMIDLSFDGELAQARRDSDDAPTEVNHSALLEAPLMLLEYLIAGPPPTEMDEMMTDVDGDLGDFSTRSELGLQGNDSREAASVFGQLVGKSLVEEGKRVAVLCYSGTVVQTEHPTFAGGVIEEISRRFKAGKINVVDPATVESWTKEHGGVTAGSDLTALGTELEADYVVQFHIETLGFAEENYPELRRGRAQGHVVVVEIAADEQDQKRPRVIFKQPFESKYPNSSSVAADPEEPDAFKQRYLARLHYELARLFLGEP